MVGTTESALPILAASLAALLLAVPAAVAQSPTYSYKVVDACSAQCLPTDPDVNPGPLPRTGNESATLILYPHVESLVKRAPMNTEVPALAEGYVHDGFSMVTLNTETGTPADVHFQNNNFRWYTSPGGVQVPGNGNWLVHSESGLAEDLEVVGETIWMYLYLGIANGPDQGQPSPVAALPAIGIYARIETGRFSYNPDETLLAEGDTAAGSPLGGATLVSTNPDDSRIWEFKVPLEVRNRTWPSVWPKVSGGEGGPNGATVTASIYQLKQKEAQPTGRTNEFTSWDWRFVAGTTPDGRTLPPRLLVEAAQPLVTKGIGMCVFGGNLYAEWSFNSPLTAYDIDVESVRAQIDDARDGDEKTLFVNVDGGWYESHFVPVKVRRTMDFRESPLADGEHTVRFSALNRQHTYLLKENVTFWVVDGQPRTYLAENGEERPIPGAKTLGAAHELPSAGVAGVLSLAVLALGRRRLTSLCSRGS